jgi:hypothetical protein
MKKTILVLLAFSFLLQSCFSYKTIDSDSKLLEIGKTYKIKVGNKEHVGKLVSVNDTLTTLQFVNKQRDFKTEDIKLIKKRKFSIVKTALLPVAIVAVISVIFLATYDPNIKLGNLNPI